jgi:regulator of protease activity HflC (stomatin/prohibitin superfamily)
MNNVFTPKRIYIAVGALVVSITLSNSIYITQEGFRGVERTLGEVTNATKPGLHFKVPIFQVVDLVEIRPRKYELILQASTAGKSREGNTELQMPSTVTIAGNWFVDPDKVKEIVSEFGSIEQFENRILDPKVREAVLAAFPNYTIEQVMTDRTILSSGIATALRESLSSFPVTITDIMVANVDWHEKIKSAVLNKQDAKLKKEEEQYRLEKQNLEAQQKVNTAKAEAEAIERMAEAEAKAITLRGNAEADAIKAKAEALKQNPELIKLIHEERWNGIMPTTLIGESASLLLNIK